MRVQKTETFNISKYFCKKLSVTILAYGKALVDKCTEASLIYLPCVMALSLCYFCSGVVFNGISTFVGYLMPKSSL